MGGFVTTEDGGKLHRLKTPRGKDWASRSTNDALVEPALLTATPPAKPPVNRSSSPTPSKASNLPANPAAESTFKNPRRINNSLADGLQSPHPSLIDTPLFNIDYNSAAIIAVSVVELESIKRRSRGDGFWKALVILQTGWFVLQVVARGVERLPVTELELLTLGLAMLNLVTYVFWWSKPFNIEAHVCVKEDPVLERRQQNNNGWILSPHEIDKNEDDDSVWNLAKKAVLSIIKFLDSIPLYQDIILLPLIIVFSPVLIPVLMATRVSTSFRKSQTRPKVAKRDRSIFVVLVVVGTIFGAIHAVAWSFAFPTFAEKLLWRVSSLIITASPAILFVLFVADMENSASIGVIIYVIGRLILLSLAFTTLRSLPDGAFQTVTWTTFIPHI